MPPVLPLLRRAVAAVLVATLAVLGVGAPGPFETARAGAADGASVVVSGHGWGHGRGMGQWGAHGYAGGQATGTPWSSDQILDHFYGNTVKGAVASNATIRVWLKAYDTNPTRFFTKSGNLTVGGITVPSPRTARITLVNGQWMLYTADSCTGAEDAGTPVSDNSALPASPPTTNDNLIRVCDGGAGKPYRGFLTVLVGDNVKRVVNTVQVEDYLRGVVPAEMPSSWEPAALQSQAVAARSYALAQGGENGNRYSWAKTCDDISCQVYSGANGEAANTDAAIAATAHQVRRSPSGVLQSTEFSASTGGWTTGTSFPNVEDKGDAHPSNPHHSWTVTLDPAAIAAKYGLGTLEGISVTKRNGLGADGGRVTEMRLDGSTKDMTVTGSAFRSDMGLKSDWFTITRGGITLQRISGADRYATAAAVASATFPSAEVAIIARGEGAVSFADGLAANFLGGVLTAPTLLTGVGVLPQVTADALQSLGVKSVKVLGGTGAVSDAVAQQLAQKYSVERIGGENRYATAAAIARAGSTSVGVFDGKKTAVLSSGVAFPDALAAGSIVYGMRFPQLLTDPATLPPETASALKDLGIQHVIITGGETAVSAAVKQAVEALGITTERPHGADRFQTAMVLADLALNRYGFSSAHVDIPTGESFPDALTAGSHAGKSRAPIVLGTKLGVATATCTFLKNRSGALDGGHIFGGPVAIDDSAKAALEGCTRA
jgi:SpoIID/LytB domain protein